MRRYEEGLAGYTYLEEEEPGREIANGSAGLTATPRTQEPEAAQPAANSSEERQPAEPHPSPDPPASKQPAKT
jgi:hypothetical protein